MKSKANYKTLVVIAVIFAFICTDAVLADNNEGKEASDRYLEYISTAQNAGSIDELTPYWSGWMLESVKNGSEEQKKARLERMKDSASKKKDLKVVSTEKSGEFWVIDLKSVYPDGMKMKGKVKMFRENGKFVIEEEYWTGDMDE